MWVSNLPAFGAQSRTGKVVWFNDAKFQTARKNQPFSPLNLVWDDKKACAGCGACSRAWRPKVLGSTFSLFFKDPVQLDSIRIHEIWNSGVKEVGPRSCGLGSARVLQRPA